MRRVRWTRFAIAMLVAALGVAALPAIAAADGVETTVTVQSATVQYSDYVTLKARVAPAGLAGSVAFTVDNSSDGLVGAPTYSPRTGLATQRYRCPLPAGEYSIDTTFTSTDELTVVQGAGTLTVRPEDARVLLTMNGRPVPWLMRATQSDSTAPFSITVTFIEVPDGTPGDLTKTGIDFQEAHCGLDAPSGAPVTSVLPDIRTFAVFNYPSGLSVGIHFIQISLSRYYSGQAAQSIAIYDPDAGMSAGAGALVNPTNGHSAIFAFVGAPQPSGSPLATFGYAEQFRVDGRPTQPMYIPGPSSFTRTGANGAVLVDDASTVMTVTARDRRVRGSADAVGIDWTQSPFTDFASFSGARLLRGGIDLR